MPRLEQLAAYASALVPVELAEAGCKPSAAQLLGRPIRRDVGDAHAHDGVARARREPQACGERPAEREVAGERLSRVVHPGRLVEAVVVRAGNRFGDAGRPLARALRAHARDRVLEEMSEPSPAAGCLALNPPSARRY